MAENRVSYEIVRPVFPSPTGLITSVDSQGKPNIITLGEVFNLSIREPVIVGVAIAPARYSHTLISEQGEYVVNLPPASLIREVMACGGCSGRDTDKFEAFGLTPIPADHVEPPLIAECIVNIECTLLEVQTFGDHDLFPGEVQAVHVSPRIVDEDDVVDADRLSTIVMTGHGFFGLGEQLDW